MRKKNAEKDNEREYKKNTEINTYDKYRYLYMLRDGESEKRECLDVFELSVPLRIYVRFLLTKPPEKQRNVVKMRRNLQKIMCRSFLGNLLFCYNYFRHAVKA